MDKINGVIFKGMLESGCNNLNGHKADVDALNVFPVPDGDTGTNMSLTFTNGISEVRKSGSDQLSVVAKTLSRGLLMGARGNSGVILSQIFRGIYQYIQKEGKEELTSKEFSEAISNGSALAYKAVMRPTEGTILTVIRESSEKGASFIESNPNSSIEEFMNVVLEEAEASLQRTPDLLPVLKEAHVVDSGGAGLVKVFEGFKAFLDGKPITEETVEETKKEVKTEHSSGYRVEYILNFDEKHAKSFNEDRFRKSLEALGNKVQLKVSEEGIQLSLHSMTPGEVLMLAQRYGGFKKVQIENIQDELKPSLLDSEEESVPQDEKEYGIIAVAAGDGIQKLFMDYRTDYVVSGGQTMNPSTEDIASAISKVNAKHVFVLPNNSNIIMAANAAAEVTENKEVIVLPTKSVPQGLSACINFNPEEDVETNKEAMEEAIANVKTGSITYAIKDTSIDGKEIHAGDYMGLLDKEIVIINKDKMTACKSLMEKMMDEDSEIVTLLKGEDASQEECDELAEYIEDTYDVDVDVQDGGQPVYSFVIGVE